MQLVEIFEDQPTASTKIISDTFGIPHKNVLSKVRNIMQQAESHGLKFSHENFMESTYKTERGKTYKHVVMTRDGFSLLAMGLTGRKAMEWKIKYIEAFNEMEKGILSVDTEMKKLSREGDKIKDFGSRWAKAGHQINQMKKKHKENVKSLVNKVQMQLEF